MTKTKEPEKWYYDACALEKDVAIHDLVNKLNKTVCVSHLALGEAYGNCVKKGGDAVEAFMKLIAQLNDAKFIEIVGNDADFGDMESIKKVVTRIDMADAVHIATAKKNECCKLKTSDRDLLGITGKKLQELNMELGIKNFNIIKI